MAASELALGLSRATDELGRALSTFEGLLDVLDDLLGRSALDELDAELAKLIAATRELCTARQWVEFHRRLMGDRVYFLEVELRRREWYDPITLWLSATLRRRSIQARLGRYQREVAQFAEVIDQLGEWERATQSRVIDFRLKVEEARRAEEKRLPIEITPGPDETGKTGTLRWLLDQIKKNRAVLGHAAMILACVPLGVPPDPVMLVSAALGESIA